ncbi:hypothetical protein GRI62_03995 [Erythrobacter arachoides]|uniref:Trimeric autotransporter adhesin YadA-like C-terminal membrane anchor domain-containing protein n=1 Tax=Aurantiacibacter arachoides TaxID=1850444 RepID=A0A844ZZU1_9SPHN|nr:YadA-like family protein [Aurantiacibacter arachoides]MXO92770.1 hypothetical protein [Aurantiacibacter arachoides]GGD54628.1 hypothetical protein GCM10011411_13200 [Aurantiacibacter arachoides]
MTYDSKNFVRNISLRAAALAAVATSALTAPGIQSQAQAQALQSVVDVCTGISLEQSALRDILETTVVPTAAGLETLYDDLLTVSLGLLPLLSIPDVDLGVDDTTAALAAGDPISLQVLDRDGNIVSPGDCNISADGYTLNTPAGLAIGGNQITGLGNGTVATAAELDAIAFGNGAITDPGAFGAVALGTNARVTVANSVALGAGSVADRGALTGYTAAFLPGTFDSVGSVSVGAAGALRQVTNVAPGTAATDAATVGQVQAAIDSVNASVANAVQYDDATQTSITLAGAGGTLITNLADGTVATGSTDAVNGSQLAATNANVATNTAAIGTLQTDVGDLQTDVGALQVDVGDLQTDLVTLQGQVGVNTGAIAGLQSDVGTLQGQVATNTGAIGTIQGQVATNTGAIAAVQADVAVNTGAIAAVQGQVATNTGAIAAVQADVAVNTGDIATLQDMAVMYDDPSHTSITLDGAGGTTVSNVAVGQLSATSTDAVNGSQLFATNEAVAALDGRVSVNETNIAANTTAIANLSTGIAGVQTDITNLDARVTVNEGDIANLDGRVTVNEGDIANLDGRVTVNEGDIANLDGRVTVNEGDIANLDGRVTVNEGDIASLDGRVTVNEGDITNLDGRVTVNEGDIANLDGRVTVNEGDIANLDTRTTINEGAITTIDQRVTNNSTSIVSIGQQVNANTTLITQVQAQVDNVPVNYVSDTDGTTPSTVPTNTAAFAGATTAPVRVTNVAAGNLAADSTDAVNGGQLAATNAQVATNRTDIDRNTADIAVLNTSFANSPRAAVQYSNAGTPTQANGGTVTQDVTLVGANVAEPVRLHNVAAGTLANDAVNVAQLNNGLSAVLADAVSYTDERFALLDAGMDSLSFDLAELRDDAFAGTAAAMAVAGIPQTMEAGQSMVGGGVGHFRGETAFAIGVSTTFNDGRGVMKAGGTLDTNGHGGFSVGAGFGF